MAKKDYQMPILTLSVFEKQDVVTLSDGALFDAQEYGWWDDATGGTVE